MEVVRGGGGAKVIGNISGINEEIMAPVIAAVVVVVTALVFSCRGSRRSGRRGGGDSFSSRKIKCRR